MSRSVCLQRAFFLLVPLLALPAETVPEHHAPVQIFMPETACVGDLAELRYIFHTDEDILGGGATHGDLPTDLPAFAAQGDRCTVLSASLDRFGSEYTLSLSLVGWKVGQIAFMPFALGSHTVQLEPVEINSIVEKTGAQGFRPPSPPLVVPGTTAVLAALAAVFLLLLAAATFALFHIPAIAAFFARSRAQRRARRNMRAALKKLRALATRRDASDDGSFCAAVQHILRGYLSERFVIPFAAVETSGLYAAVSGLCGGTLDEAQDAMMEELLYLFNRTDYIRYAHADLQAGEKEILLSVAVDAVESIGGAHGDL